MSSPPVDRRLSGGPAAAATTPSVVRLFQPVLRDIETHPREAGIAFVLWTTAVTGLAVHSPTSVLAILLVAVLAILLVRFPEWALVALVFVEPFHTVLYAAISVRGHTNVQAVSLWKDILIGLLVARGVVRQIIAGRSFREVFAPGDRALIGYALLLSLIATMSPDLQSAGYSLATDAEGPGLFLAVMLLRPSRRQLRAAIWAMLAAATVMGIAALAEQGPKASFDPWWGNPRPGLISSFILGDGSYRSGSFLGSPLAFAFYAAGAASLATGVAAGARGRARLLASLATLVIAAGLVVSFTRSGLIGGGVGVLLAIILGVRRPRVRLALVGSLVIIAGSAALASLASGDEHLAHSGEGNGHADQLQGDFTLFAYNPLGYGLGSVDAVAQRFDRNSGFATESTLLSKGLQGGIEDLVAYLVVLYWTAMRVRRARQIALAAGDTEAAGLCAGALGAQWAIFLAGFFLGVEALPVEIVLWGAPALALAFVAAPRDRAVFAARA